MTSCRLSAVTICGDALRVEEVELSTFGAPLGIPLPRHHSGPLCPTVSRGTPHAHSFLYIVYSTSVVIQMCFNPNFINEC